MTVTLTDYLETNLLPLILSIKTPKTESYIMIAAGLEDNTSYSSIMIQMGNKLEEFFNKVASDTDDSDCVNMIEGGNKIKVKGKNRQLDHVIKVRNKILYLESKCNLNFDTEKKPASNAKVAAVCAALSDAYGEEVSAGYFVPCIRTIPANVQKKYPKISVYGVEWFLETINCTLFTADEYFTFFEQVVGPILEQKIYG